MTISMIAAVGKNGEIGRGGALPWHIPADLKFFKKVTLGKCVVMGRKTFESLPGALPGRKNIVISSAADYKPQGAFAARDISSALSLADSGEVFIIGGESIYRQFLPMAERLYITEVDCECSEADAFFPEFDRGGWKESFIDSGEEGSLSFRHILFERTGEDICI